MSEIVMLQRRAPGAAALARMAQAIAPGCRVTNVRRLPGGIDAAMHTVDLVAPDGCRQRLVVRRVLEAAPGAATAELRRTWQALEALAQLGIAAPRPVLLDEQGDLFGTPAFVMTRVPGRSTITPRNQAAWIDQLAAALAALHRAPIAGVDLSLLHQPETYLPRVFRWAMRHTEDDTANPDNAAVRDALTRWWPRLRKETPVLIHGDYWGGNVTFQRDRLTAIVDWDGAAVCYPGVDVGYVRSDLNMLIGPGTAERFLATYEAAAGRRIPQLHVWDLLGASRALPDPERWLPGQVDLGHTHNTAAILRARLHAFIAAALARAG